MDTVIEYLAVLLANNVEQGRNTQGARRGGREGRFWRLLYSASIYQIKHQLLLPREGTIVITVIAAVPWASIKRHAWWLRGSMAAVIFAAVPALHGGACARCHPSQARLTHESYAQ